MGILTGNGESLICNLENHKCFSCGKQFIIGTELLDDEKTSCPYCRAYGTEKSAWTEDEDLRETPLDLGCLSIVKDFEDLKYFEKINTDTGFDDKLLEDYKKQKLDYEQKEEEYKEISEAWWAEIGANGDATERADILGIKLDKVSSDMKESRVLYNYLAHEVLRYYMFC